MKIYSFICIVAIIKQLYEIDLNNASFIQAIKKYNGSCQVLAYSLGVVVRLGKGWVEKNKLPDNEHWTCAQFEPFIPQIREENEQVNIVFKLVSYYLHGFLPILPLQAVRLAKEDQKTLVSIDQFIYFSLNPPRFRSDVWDKEIKIGHMDPHDLLHALNIQFSVTGAVQLDQKILLEIKGKLFVIDCATAKPRLRYLPYFGLDLNAGFVCPLQSFLMMLLRFY